MDSRKALSPTFNRRGIVEGFFGPLWTMAHRRELFNFGAARGMNTYLYAPKDDPYHRKRWRLPYPPGQWKALVGLIHEAQKQGIDFVYGFHPGEGLCFTEDEPVRVLLKKARRFYDQGVRTFAVLFDDIPSRLEHAKDRKAFGNSLARAEGSWLRIIQETQPTDWQSVEWWICPSYYTPDPLLERMFGTFESDFLETLGQALPPTVACFWTGPRVVPKTISLAHVRQIAKRVKRRLILWDNYPVNDLSMNDELHLGPLTGRDHRLPSIVYGYLNNPLLQEALSFIPLSTCFDYAADPFGYDPESRWAKNIVQRFGGRALSHWRAIRLFCEQLQIARKTGKPIRIKPSDAVLLQRASRYVERHRNRKWARELRPWLKRIPEVTPTAVNG
jgi:hyaluronoglucosaminidase